MNEFVWFTHNFGHRIRDLEIEAVGEDSDHNRRGPWVLPSDVFDSTTKRWRRYTPLKSNPGLFRNFAENDCTEASILNFADNYGLLTDPVKGESLPKWKEAIAEIRSAVEHWETAQKAELIPRSLRLGTAAKSAFDVVASRSAGPESGQPSTTLGEAGVAWHRALELSREQTANSELISETISTTTRIKPDCDVDVLRFYLGSGASITGENWNAIARQLNKHISDVRLTFNFDAVLDGLRSQFIPSNLLAAMWLQFGQAVEANKSFRKCRLCGVWFELTPKTARSDKTFCSGACKARAYRQRLTMQGHVKHGSEELPKATNKVI